MSDISKKIHSIDPEGSSDGTSKTNLNLSPDSNSVDGELLIPSFVTRNDALSSSYYDEEPRGRGIIISGLLLGLLWAGLGMGLIFMKGLTADQNLSLYELILIGCVITLPALLIIFLAITLQKLRHIHSKSERLADIGEQLIKADESAASNTSTLARAIRSEIKRVNTDLSGANETLARLKDDTAQHLATIEDTTSKTVSLSDKVVSSFEAQEHALAKLVDMTKTQLTTLSENLQIEKDALQKTTHEADSILSALSEKLEAKLSTVSETASTIDTQVQTSMKTIATLEENVASLSTDLTEKINVFGETTEKLTSENQALSAQMEKHSSEFSKTSALSKQAENAVAEHVKQAQSIEDTLRETSAQAQTRLSEHLNLMNEELEKGQTLSENTLSALEQAASNLLNRFDMKAEAIEKKLHNLNVSLETIDGRLQQSAETRKLDLDLPVQHPTLPTTRASGKRLHLKPLDDTDIAIGVESSDTHPQTQAIGSNPHSQLFDQISGLMHPLDLDDEVELAMPLPDIRLSQPAPEIEVKTEAEQDETDEVIKPLTDSGPLFGKSKAKTKTKTGWRWRDMMGGFNSEDVADTPSDVESPSFQSQLSDIGIDPDAIISDGTILDVANAYVSKKKPVEQILEQRLSDVAQHLRVHARDSETFLHAAFEHRGTFADTINPDIMNAEAIRNRLATPEGRVYLLSLLT